MSDLLFFPTSIYHSVQNSKLITWLDGIDEDGKSRHVPLVDTRPRFWTTDDVSKGKDAVAIKAIHENDGVDFWGNPLHCVEVDYPYDIPKVRGLFRKTYEADRYHDARVRFDYGIRNCIYIDGDAQWIDSVRPADPHVNLEPRIWTMDIETYYTNTGASGAYPTDKVTSIAIHDSLADKYIVILNGDLSDEEREKFLRMCKERKAELTEDYQDVEWDVRISTCPSEMHLFLELHRLMSRLNPQIIRGWNFCSTSKYHEGFDWPYLTNRAQDKGFPFLDDSAFQIWDSMKAYERVHSRAVGKPKDGVSLNAVAVNEGIGRKMEHAGVDKLYDEDRAGLLYYNVMDVFLTKTIDEEAFGGITKFYLDLAREAGCSLEDTTSEMRMVDSYVTHWLGENRPTVRQQTVPRHDNRDVVGGLVLKPAEKGIHGPTAEIDLSQAYTAAIRSCNISPETKVVGEPEPGRSYITMESGRHYYTDVQGIFPAILDGLSEKMHRLKAEGKHQQRQATKSINHSFYGNTKNEYYRNRDVDMAEDILMIVRDQSKYNADFATERQFRVLYGDTDSIYITGPDDIDQLAREASLLAQEINESYGEWVKKFGITKHYFAVDHDDTFVAQIFTMKKSGKGEAKKRYAALKRDGSLKVRGFDFRRSDKAVFARNVQYDVLKLVLEERDVMAARKFIQGVQDGIKNGDYPITDLAIPKGLGNPVGKYMDNDGIPVKKCPQHFRAAIWSNKHLGTELDWGDKTYLYHGYIMGYPKTDVFALPWGQDPPEGARINVEKHLELVFKSPLEPILDALGMTWNDATTGAIGTKLEQWI